MKSSNGMIDDIFSNESVYSSYSTIPWTTNMPPTDSSHVSTLSIVIVTLFDTALVIILLLILLCPTCCLSWIVNLFGLECDGAENSYQEDSSTINETPCMGPNTSNPAALPTLLTRTPPPISRSREAFEMSPLSSSV